MFLFSVKAPTEHQNSQLKFKGKKNSKKNQQHSVTTTITGNNMLHV